MLAPRSQRQRSLATSAVQFQANQTLILSLRFLRTLVASARLPKVGIELVHRLLQHCAMARLRYVLVARSRAQLRLRDG
jgi:hypothetical protein